MAHSVSETIEEVMIGDDHENFEDMQHDKWMLVDMVFLFAMCMLMIYIAITNRNQILHSQLDIFIMMVLFISYQLVSYLICFALSVIVYILLCLVCMKQKAYRLGRCYLIIQELLEAVVLMLCATYGIYMIATRRLDYMTSHRFFVWCMLFVIAFKFLRFFLHFFSKGGRINRQVELFGNGMFRVRRHTGIPGPV